LQVEDLYLLIEYRLLESRCNIFETYFQNVMNSVLLIRKCIFVELSVCVGFGSGIKKTLFCCRIDRKL